MDFQSRLFIVSKRLSSHPPPILFQSNSPQLCTVTLNRPQSLNAINIDMMDHLSFLLPTLNHHQVTWLQGSGGKAFCAGGDVKSLFSTHTSREQKLIFFRKEFVLNYQMATLKTLTITCWNGIVMGGGAGLSIYSPFIIATENTVFSLPEAKIGAFVSSGCYHALSKLKHNLGYYLAMTEAQLKGEDVFIAGLAHYYIPSSKLKAVYDEMKLTFRDTVQNPRDVVASILRKYHSPSGRTDVKHQQQICQLFEQSSARAIYEKASSIDDEFHRHMTEIMKAACPMATQLIHRSMLKAGQRTLKEEFQHQFHMVEHMVVSDDFLKGVQSVLVKRQPIKKWSSPDYEDLRKEDVAKFLKRVQPVQSLFSSSPQIRPRF